MTSVHHFNPPRAGTTPAAQNPAPSDLAAELAQLESKRGRGLLYALGFIAWNGLGAFLTGGLASAVVGSLLLGVPVYLALQRRGEASAWVLFAIAVLNVGWAAFAWVTQGAGSVGFWLGALFCIGFYELAMVNRKQRLLEAA